MVHLSAAEEALVDISFKHWASALETQPEGRAIVANLIYDLRTRPETHPAFTAFAGYLKSTGLFDTALPLASLNRTRVLSHTRHVYDFCKTATTLIPPSRLAPQVNEAKLKKQSPDLRFRRVVEEDRLPGAYLLYANLVHRVPTPRMTMAINWTISKAKLIDSFATRKALEEAARRASKSGKAVVFLTPSVSLDRLPKTRKGQWASERLGLRHERPVKLCVLDFKLNGPSGHWRPTTFSSGAYFAFCAFDHRDGFGRTMPLSRAPKKNLNRGCRELIVADEFPIILEDAFPVGTCRETATLVDLSRIESDLVARTPLP
jgi:hypothetical protein